MTKFKKLMALAAVSMLGIQLMGVGTALAGTGTSNCDFGRNDLEIAVGSDKSVDLWIEDGTLYCDDNSSGGQFNAGGGGGGGGADGEALSSIESITVEMDDDGDDESLYISLEDQGDGSVADWPEFDTFDINVSTTLYIDGTGLASGARTSVKVVVGAKSLAFGGTTATFVAPKVDVQTGAGNDTIDASKATVKIYADGDAGNDLIKGGSKNDELYGDDGRDVVYGGVGNDDIYCDVTSGTEKGDQGWGGDGMDDITECYTVAPGAGDDTVDDAFSVVTYADLTGGIEYSYDDDLSEVVTGGAAGADEFGAEPAALYGSQGDDVIADGHGDLFFVGGLAGDDMIKVSAKATSPAPCSSSHPCGATVLGGGGNDLIVALDAGDDAEDAFYGNAGDDILKGKQGDDVLAGGPGKDQAWGGPGVDTCGAEVMNRCEYLKKNSV